MVMPTVINRNAALATPALESKSTLRRNAAQSPLPTSSIIAVAPPIASTIAAGPNRRWRIASSTSSVAITSEPCRPSPTGSDGRRVDGCRSCGSSTRSRPGTTNSDTASSATVTTARWTCTLMSARLTSTVMTPPVTPPRLHRPCKSVHHRRATARAEHRPLHVHRDVDEHVEEQQTDEADDQHRRGGGEADDRQRADRHDRADDHHPARAQLGDHPAREQAADQTGDAGQREDETERADRDADPVADLGELGDERGVDDAVGEELHRHRLQRASIARALSLPTWSRPLCRHVLAGHRYDLSANRPIGAGQSTRTMARNTSTASTEVDVDHGRIGPPPVRRRPRAGRRGRGRT